MTGYPLLTNRRLTSLFDLMRFQYRNDGKRNPCLQSASLRAEDLPLGNTTSAFAQWEKTFGGVVAQNYELVVPEVIRKRQKDLFPFSRVGRWWEGNEEIDLIALNENTNAILFGEAKWSNKQIGTNIYEGLKKKAKLVTWGKKDRKEHFALFSKSGFTPDMKKLANKEKVFLFEKNKLIRS